MTDSTPNTSTDSSTSSSPVKKSLTLEHLAAYPTIAALIAFVLSAPGVGYLSQHGKPLLDSFSAYTKPILEPLLELATPLLTRADEYGNQLLKAFDAKFPGAKSVHPSDLYEGAQARVNKFRETAQTAYDARVRQPVLGAAQSAKSQYTKVYDTHLNERIAPLNDRLQGAIDTYLPAAEGSDSEKAASTSESQIERTISLARTAAARAAPHVEAARDQTRKHIVSVYSDKLGGVESPGLVQKVKAAAATGRTVGQEASNKAFEYVRPKEKFDAAVEQVKTTANGYVSSAQKTVNGAVETAKGRVAPYVDRVSSTVNHAKAASAAEASAIESALSDAAAEAADAAPNHLVSPKSIAEPTEQLVPITPVY